MSVLPAAKYFRVIKGITFDYRWVYLQGSSAQSLVGYTARWYITSLDGLTTYMTLSTGALAGQSGVFFGGDAHDPTNGVVDLVISAADTAALTWTAAAHQLVFTTPTNTTVELM